MYNFQLKMSSTKNQEDREWNEKRGQPINPYTEVTQMLEASDRDFKADLVNMPHRQLQRCLERKKK